MKIRSTYLGGIILFVISIILFYKFDSGKENYLGVNNMRSSNIDSVFVYYFRDINAIEYEIKYHNGELSVSNEHLELKKAIDFVTSEIFIKSVQNLFVEKRYPIIVRKNKHKYFKSGDISLMRVLVFCKNKIVLKEEIQLWDEVYEIQYSDEFTKLRFLLDSLTTY